MNIYKIFTLLFVAALLVSSCKNGQENSGQIAAHKKKAQKSTVNERYLIGSWEDPSSAALHFTLFADGTAHSDNMSTLLYEKWYVKDNNLYLVVKSLGNKSSSTDTEVYIIEHLDESQMKLKQKNRILEYKKVQQNKKPIQNRTDETMSKLKVKTLRGRLTLGHEANSFQPCRSKHVFWVSDKTGKLKKLYGELTVGENPYTPIYAEIEFIDKGKANEGFPAEYESVYEIVKILRTTKISDNNCE